MIPLTTAEIAEATGGRAGALATVTGLAVDSRLVSAGDLFVALPGARTDGALFAQAALEAGAAAVLAARGRGGPHAIEVDDPLAALAQVAALVRSRSRARVIAITGSTGKTSTKDILAALIAPHLQVASSPANFNTEIGLPLTLGRIEPETRVVVCEMGMRGPGQIAELAAIARPDIGVITGVGPVHLELMGTVEAVAAAKAELLAALPDGAVAVVPQGEPLLEPYLDRDRLAVVGFGREPGADVWLTGFGGGRAELAVHGRTVSVPVNFTEPHNALNLAAAVAAYDGLGLPLEGLAEGAAAISLSPLRGERVDRPGGGLAIIDCYNANPVSMRAALEHLAVAAQGRRTVAVLGEMAELGAAAAGYHDQVGALARSLPIDLVVGIGELARRYGGDWFADAGEAGHALPGLLRDGDAVLLKGSRSARLERLIEVVTGA